MKELLIAIGFTGLFVLGAARGAVIHTRDLYREAERNSLTECGTVYTQGSGEQGLMVIKDLSGAAENIHHQFVDRDSIYWAAYVNDDYIFDYNTDSQMYIGWTKDDSGYRDYVVWYDNTLPGPVWYFDR